MRYGQKNLHMSIIITTFANELINGATAYVLFKLICAIV